jgi:hypothetical protein
MSEATPVHLRIHLQPDEAGDMVHQTMMQNLNPDLRSHMGGGERKKAGREPLFGL